jgi:hypothetical protein
MQAAPEMWTTEEMNTAMERKESEYNYGKVDVDIIDPGKCQTNYRLGLLANCLSY